MDFISTPLSKFSFPYVMIIAAMAYQAWAFGGLLRVPSEEKGFEYVLMEKKLLRLIWPCGSSETKNVTLW